MNTHAHDERIEDATCESRIVDAAAVAQALSELPAPEVSQRLVRIFQALGDQTRARILLALAGRPLCVCDLAEIAGVTQSAASHQLHTLRLLDLVTWERDGKRAVYRLADDHVRDLLTTGLAHAAERASR